MILCVGDFIEDFYVFGTALRLCPEAPVPVVVPVIERTSAGGVGLVANQLRELGAEIVEWHGSFSRKERTFCGQHLISRLDRDSLPFEPEPFPDEALRDCEAVIVSDYGKGGMYEEIADELIRRHVPLFVDAKHHWEWYITPNSYWFPNEHETEDAKNWIGPADGVEIISKLGDRGCKWNELEIPATVKEVVDVTGAGDIFLAAFVYATAVERLMPRYCLEFANALAGESCRHRGTYVVPKAFALEVLGNLSPSEEFARQVENPVVNSMPSKYQRLLQDDLVAESSGAYKDGNLPANWRPVEVGYLDHSYIPWSDKTLPESPSGPIESSAAPAPKDSEKCSREKSQTERTDQNSTESEHQCEHTPGPDQGWIG